MSAHAEAKHGHESADHGLNNESVFEKLGEAVKNVIDSVKIAVSKVYNGVKGFLKDIFTSSTHSNGAHGAQESHAAPAASHAAPAAAH